MVDSKAGKSFRISLDIFISPEKVSCMMGYYVNAFYYYYALKIRAFSSAGLEHYLDKVGVTGSNPVMPTGK
jgi:hypothetical protein